MAALAVFGSLSAAAFATPMEDCAPSSVPLVCLDAKLRAVNQQLNATLKAAQERLEQMQAHGRRPVLGAFIDSQRKFNAYRDAQCNWQGIRAASAASSAEYIKDCQIRATAARQQELADFLAERDASPAVAVASVAEQRVDKKITEPSPVTEQPAAADALPTQPEMPPAPSAPASTASRGNEWRLTKWVVNGAEKPIVPDSAVTVAFDPSGKIAGNASVNRFSGTYRFDLDGRLEWPRAGFAVTKMAGPQPLMAQERVFLESLRRTTQYRVDGQQLVLESQSGTTILTFAR
jgi:heat shock protein HslJ